MFIREKRTRPFDVAQRCGPFHQATWGGAGRCGAARGGAGRRGAMDSLNWLNAACAALQHDTKSKAAHVNMPARRGVLFQQPDRRMTKGARSRQARPGYIHRISSGYPMDIIRSATGRGPPRWPLPAKTSTATSDAGVERCKQMLLCRKVGLSTSDMTTR